MSGNMNKDSAHEGVTTSERSQLAGASNPSANVAAATVSPPSTNVWASTMAVTQRELASLFFSPIAYVVGFIFLLLTGYYFVTETMLAGHEATMRILFERMAAVLVFALPLLTMRSVAEELSTGAIETLMTAPVSDSAVIVGKFLGSLLFYGILLATTLLHVGLMARYTEPIWTSVLVGYLGMILLGGMFIAIGVFASTCTRHQLLAAVIAIGILALLTFVTDYGAEFADQVWQRDAFAYLNIMGHFSDFSKGIIDTASLIFFVSGICFFLFLAVKVLESRRWR